MADAVVMPQMGYDMNQGTVVRWLKHEGDSVAAHEAIAEIETDKAVVEIESSVSGSVLKIVVAEGSTVPVGETIAYIGQVGEEVLEGTAAPAASPQATTLVAAASTPVVPPTGGGADAKASPIARKLAAEHGVDLKKVTGTGPGGRITRDDVLAAAGGGAAGPAVTSSPAQSTPAQASGPLTPRLPGTDGTIAVGRMGQAIARRTQSTMNEAPHFYLTVRVDMTDAVAAREALNLAAAANERVSVNDVVLKACALALVKHPVFNSTFEEDHLNVQPHVNLGIAVALPEGLVVPAVLECENKSVTQIAVAARDLAARAKAGTLRQEEYTGTFSVSNLGMLGVDSFTAIIVSPQVAVLAVGEVQEATVPINGGIQIREIMHATLSVDHRAANGAEAAMFAGEIKSLLEDPGQLIPTK